MKKLTAILSLSLLSYFMHSQVYQEDIQLGILGGALITSKPGIGLQALGELKIAKRFSLSYRALSSAGENVMLFGGARSNKYVEQAILFGFHQPIGKSRFSAFAKAGPASYKLTTSTIQLLFKDESPTYKGSELAVEIGASYEYKALDIQLVVGKTDFNAVNKNPFILGIRIGLDPFYWLLPKNPDSSKTPYTPDRPSLVSTDHL
ncbi:hypothetical protein [Owenweeksia hongkongensis]|uniref:hypothetical protein n=1 Tax=Owenweeksia hongkongensis TaxID=253245 RepID=UPI003A8EAAAB